MGKPVAGEVVVVPFPQTDLNSGRIILYSVGFVKSEKLAAVRAKIRNIFV